MSTKQPVSYQKYKKITGPRGQLFGLQSKMYNLN